MPLSDCPIISQMTDRHCTLSWKPSIPSAPRFPVTYQLEMCELPNGNWFTVRTGIRSCTCGVRNLEPFRDYKFRVRVENAYGISDPSPYAITHRYVSFFCHILAQYRYLKYYHADFVNNTRD